MDIPRGSETEEQASSSFGGRDILDVVSSVSTVLLRFESSRKGEDRELMVTESGLVGIRTGSEGGLYDIHDKSVEFGQHDTRYRISMGRYGIQVSEIDFKQFLRTYNKLREENK